MCFEDNWVCVVVVVVVVIVAVGLLKSDCVGSFPDNVVISFVGVLVMWGLVSVLGLLT